MTSPSQILALLLIVCFLCASGVQSQTAEPKPECKAAGTGCLCDIFKDNSTCRKPCNVQACDYHNNQCKCNNQTGDLTAAFPTGGPYKTVPCTETAIGKTCTYTCDPATSELQGTATLTCVSDGPAGGSASGGVWKLTSGKCNLLCKTKPTDSFLVTDSFNCTDGKPGAACVDYTCKNDTDRFIKTGQYVCDPAGTGVWIPQGGICVPSVCKLALTTKVGATNFTCPQWGDNNPAPNGTICPYDCDQGYVWNGLVTCVNGIWTNQNACLPSCGQPIGVFNLAATGIRQTCLWTNVALDATGNNTFPYPLNARAGDQCGYMCNTLGLGLDVPWPQEGRIKQPLEGPCNASLTCNANAAIGAKAWTSTGGKFNTCLGSCSTDFLTNFIQGDGGKLQGLTCAYYDERDGNTKYIASNTARTIDANFTITNLNWVPHAWQCDLRCTDKYLRSGSPGPYCYKGNWVWQDRRGRSIPATTCTLDGTKSSNPTNDQNVTDACTQANLDTFTATFKAGQGRVQIDDCPNESIGANNLSYPHLTSFRLACPLFGYELAGAQFVQCVDGSWLWGGKAADSPSQCMRNNLTRIVACPTLTAANVSNAAATFQCAGITDGGYCQVVCADGFSPKYFATPEGAPLSNGTKLNANRWWWQKGIKCSGTNWDINFDFTRVCVDSCVGRKSSTNDGLTTVSGCPNPTVGCDGFCNLDGQTDVNTVVTGDTIRECTGLGCNYDATLCPKPKANLTIDILQVRVDIEVQGVLPPNAWAGIYRAGETSNYKFLAATHLSRFGIKVNNLYSATFDINTELYWNVGGWASWVQANTFRNGSKSDLEVRVFPDLDVSSTSLPLATTSMCNTIACNNTAKVTSKQSQMYVQEMTSERVMHVLESRRLEQFGEELKQVWDQNPFPGRAALPSGEKVIGMPRKSSRRGSVQGALNKHNAVVPSLCLELTSCTCDLYGDNKCDPACNNEICNYDNFDCKCLDFPPGQDATYANRSCVADNFGAGGNKGGAAGNTTQWEFHIGATCGLTCAPNTYAIQGPLAVPGQVTSVSQVTVRCNRNQVPLTSGGNWESWPCRPNCTGDITAELGAWATDATGLAACMSPNNTNARYYGPVCPYACGNGKTITPNVFVYCGGNDTTKSTWMATGNLCTGLPAVSPTCPQREKVVDTAFTIQKTDDICVTSANATGGYKCVYTCAAGFSGTGRTFTCNGTNGQWDAGFPADCYTNCPNTITPPAQGTPAQDGTQAIPAVNGQNCSAVFPNGNPNTCAIGCKNDFTVWDSAAKLYGGYQCNVAEVCRAQTFTASAYTIGNKSIFNEAPQCYAPCPYANLKAELFAYVNTSLYVAPVSTNATAVGLHGQEGRGFKCLDNSTIQGTGWPWCYRGAWIWVNINAQPIVSRIYCNAPAPPPTTPTTPQPVPSPPPASPPAPAVPTSYCSYDSVKNFNTTTVKPQNAWVVDTSFLCSDAPYRAGTNITVFFGNCSQTAPMTCQQSPTGANDTWVLTNPCKPKTGCAAIGNISNSVMDSNACAGLQEGEMCEIKCQPGYTVRFGTFQNRIKDNFWVPGALCLSGTWANVPMCVPTCEGLAGNDTTFATPGTCDPTDPLLCDWFCSKGLLPDDKANNAQSCSARACRLKGIEEQCSDPVVKVSIAPIKLQLNWAFSRDVPSTAWFGFSPQKIQTTDQFMWARTLPAGTTFQPNATNPWNKLILWFNTDGLTALTKPPAPVLDVDWVLPGYSPIVHGDLTVKIWEDHSATRALADSSISALATQAMCASNIDCKAPNAPDTAASSLPPRSDKCTDRGCDCNKLGDGVCDQACNNDDCGFDLQDCGCNAPDAATVRSALWNTACANRSSLTGSKPPYGVGDPCTFTCPPGYVVRDPATGIVKPASNTYTTKCQADRFSLFGGRWENFVCEAPCTSQPPVVNYPSTRVAYDTNCNNAASGTICKWSCNDTTWAVPLGRAFPPVICVDGRWNDYNQPTCAPQCNVTLLTQSDTTQWPVQPNSGSNNFTWNCPTNGWAPVGTFCKPKCNTASDGFSGAALCSSTDGITATWTAANGGPICVNVTTPPVYNCSLAEINAQIDNGVVLFSDCAGAFANGSDYTVTHGSSCNFNCDPAYFKTGGAAGKVTCNNGTWTPRAGGYDEPYCHSPCKDSPPVDGGLTCKGFSENYTATVVGQACGGWGCDSFHLQDKCSGTTPVKCLNRDCQQCSGSEATSCTPAPAAGCTRSSYFSARREWRLETPITNGANEWRRPYCFRACPVISIFNTDGLISCGDQPLAGGILKHAEECVPKCAAGYVPATTTALCYDGAFLNLGTPCVKQTTGCTGGSCCYTSDLQQPAYAILSGDVNDPTVEGTCRDVWGANETVTFSCNKGATVYSWYSNMPGQSSSQLGNGTMTARCQGVGNKWVWEWNGVQQPAGTQVQCSTNTACGPIVWDPIVGNVKEDGKIRWGAGGSGQESNGMGFEIVGNATWNGQNKFVVCQDPGNGGDCIMKCKEGYVVAWTFTETKVLDKVLFETYKYGPYCSGGQWVNVPSCEPACTQAECSGSFAYSTQCDGVCADDIGDTNCAGPACGYDGGKCTKKPTITELDIVPTSYTVTFWSDRQLSQSAWMAAYGEEEGDATNYRWAGARQTIVSNRTVKNDDGSYSYSARLALDRDTAKPNYYQGVSDVEVRLYADVLTEDKYVLGRTSMCDYGKQCEKNGFAAKDSGSSKSTWMIIFFIFLALTILFLIIAIVLFLKLKAASGGKSGSYNEL